MKSLEKEIEEILEAEEPKVYGDWKKFSSESKKELARQILTLFSKVIDQVIGEDKSHGTDAKGCWPTDEVHGYNKAIKETRQRKKRWFK